MTFYKLQENDSAAVTVCRAEITHVGKKHAVYRLGEDKLIHHLHLQVRCYIGNLLVSTTTPHPPKLGLRHFSYKLTKNTPNPGIGTSHGGLCRRLVCGDNRCIPHLVYPLIDE